MPILIACSPSTGSSLLRRILNRHSQIFCGPETSLFAKKEFYVNWDEYKNNILSGKSKQLLNMGWHHMKGVNLQDENDFTNQRILEMAKSSFDFKSFVNTYFDELLQVGEKCIWAEKTPSNAFAIDDFKNLFPNAKIIHVVRNPYDTVASLVNRGMSIYNALNVYLLNVCQCLEHENKPNYNELRYEELVSSPMASIGSMCDFFNVKFEEHMIASSVNEIGVDHMKGWNYRETAKIGKESVGRFDKLPTETKALIQWGMQNIQSTLDTSNTSYEDIFESLKYDKKDISLPINNFYFQTEMIKDKFKRLMQKSYFRSSNYPVRWTK